MRNEVRHANPKAGISGEGGDQLILEAKIGINAIRNCVEKLQGRGSRLPISWYIDTGVRTGGAQDGQQARGGAFDTRRVVSPPTPLEEH